MAASLLWKYFYQDKTYYKTDKTHKNAWCKRCLEARKRVIMELDASKVRGGLHRFIQKWVGLEVVVQDRRILSGKVLDKEAQKVEDAIRRKVQGKLATGQCDGWKNVAKSSIVSSVMSVENVVSKATPYL